MLASNATTNKPNSAYPAFFHRVLCVPLLEIVKPVKPARTERKSTVSPANLFPRLSHDAQIELHRDAPRYEAQPLEPYRNPSTREYPTHSFKVLYRVVLNNFSSSVIERDTNHPPTSRAKPRASKIESTYIPILQFLAIVFGFSTALQRNGVLRFAMIAIFLATAILALLLSLAAVFGNLSTEI